MEQHPEQARGEGGGEGGGGAMGERRGEWEERRFLIGRARWGGANPLFLKKCQKQMINQIIVRDPGLSSDSARSHCTRFSYLSIFFGLRRPHAVRGWF